MGQQKIAAHFALRGHKDRPREEDLWNVLPIRILLLITVYTRLLRFLNIKEIKFPRLVAVMAYCKTHLPAGISCWAGHWGCWRGGCGPGEAPSGWAGKRVNHVQYAGYDWTQDPA